MIAFERIGEVHVSVVAVFPTSIPFVKETLIVSLELVIQHPRSSPGRPARTGAPRRALGGIPAPSQVTNIRPSIVVAHDDGLGTKDVLIAGETNCFAVLIDMNRLFEMFVFRLVELVGLAMRVHYQRADRSS